MSYLKQKGKSQQFWFYEEAELDKVLGSSGLKLKHKKEIDIQ